MNSAISSRYFAVIHIFTQFFSGNNSASSAYKMTDNREKIALTDIPKQDSDEREQKESLRYPFWFSKRFLILVLLFCGSISATYIRYAINIAVIGMTTPKTKIIDNETIHQPAEFNWDTSTIGVVLASHWYGYFFAAAGGYLATKFGGSVTFGVSSIFTALLTAFSPILLRWSFGAFMAGRILAGFFDGIAAASTAEVFSRWIPTRERSSFMSITQGASYISIVVSYTVCGYIAYHWDWPMIFYLAGAFYLIWSVVWLSAVRNEPAEDNFISRKELEYIISQTETSSRDQINHPYCKILTSASVWALLLSNFVFGAVSFMTTNFLPQYVKDVTNRGTDEIGLISSIPNWICILAVPFVGVIMDFFQNTHNLRPSQIHTVFTGSTFVAQSMLFAAVAFSANFTFAMTCFVLIKLLSSINFLILPLIYMSMAPRHSSVLSGLTSAWFVVGHISMPSIVGFILVNHTLDEWRTCFLANAAILMVATIVYVIYGSSELQPWAMPEPSGNNEGEEKLSDGGEESRRLNELPLDE